MTDFAGRNKLVIYPLSESAVTIEFGHTIDEVVMGRVMAFDRQLKQQPFEGMYQTVQAYASLTVFFEPLIVVQTRLPGKNCYDKVRSYLQQLAVENTASPIEPESEPISIPVCYGGAPGPDLEYVAKYHQLSPDEVIRLHSGAVYAVYMIGFIPGFAYMGGLNDLLETPRKATPARVQAGAVGIAGRQTGIYPLEIPGGWQIIGQTPLKLFDARRQPAALLKAGDRVKFNPISMKEFKKIYKNE